MSSQLHALINSLDKAEKRFLRLFAAGGAGRSFDSTLRLFDLIDAMPQWDEEAILKSLPKPSMVANLSSLKTRLLDLITESQRQLQAGKTIGSQLRASIDDIEFLVGKQQFGFAKKRLRKAKGLAIQYEEEGMVLQLLYWELQLFLRSPEEQENVFFERLEGDQAHHLARLALQQGFLRLHERIRGLMRTFVRARKPAEIDAYRAIILDPLMQTPPPEDAFFATSLFLQIRGSYHIAMGEVQSAWDNFDLLMRRWERHADQIEHRSDLYLSSLNNFLGTCLSDTKFHRHFLEGISRAKQLTGIPPTTKAKMNRVVFLQELLFRMNFSTFMQSQAFLVEIEAWLLANASTLEPARLLNFYYNLSQFHFLAGKFKGANRWLQKILQFPTTDARQDIQNFAPIFQLVLQYELGNLDLQEYLLRNATRQLKREGKVYELEKAVLRWVKRMQKLPSNPAPDAQRAFLDLVEILTQLTDIQTGRPPLGLTELMIWAESKVHGVEMGEYAEKRMRGEDQNIDRPQQR